MRARRKVDQERGASQLRQELRREDQAEMSQVLGYLRQMDQRLQKVSSKVEELEEERNRGRKTRQEMKRRVELNSGGSSDESSRSPWEVCLVSWYLRVGPKRNKPRQKRMMWASHGVARCSSHDLSILLPTFSVHSAHNASFWNQCHPWIRCSAGLRIVWRYGRKRTPHRSWAQQAWFQDLDWHQQRIHADQHCCTTREFQLWGLLFLKKTAVPEDSDVLHRQTFGSQRCAASKVPALRNLDSLSSTKKSVRGYETIVQSFSNFGKPMQGNRAFTRTGKPVRSDESVESVERKYEEHKLIEIIIQETDSAFVNTLKGKLKLPFKEKMKREEDYLMLKPTLRVGNRNRENQDSPCVRLIKNLNLKWGNCSRRVSGLIKLEERERERERGLICVENWSEETDFIMKVMSKQTKRSKNYEQFTMKKQMKFQDYNLTNCLYNKKEIRKLWTDSWSKFKNYMIKWVYNQKTQNFTILAQRAVQRNHVFLPNPWLIRVQKKCLAAILHCRPSHGRPHSSKRIFLSCIRKFEKAIFFVSWNGTWVERKELGIAERSNERAARFSKSCSMLPKRSWFIRSYWWNLFSRWCDPLSEISNLGYAYWKISRLCGISKLESQHQDWSLIKKEQIFSITICLTQSVSLHWMKKLLDRHAR